MVQSEEAIELLGIYNRLMHPVTQGKVYVKYTADNIAKVMDAVEKLMKQQGFEFKEKL